ncbi:NAD-glutamate dehydrogenase [Hoyosella rhizosphaerae]|uniref:Glutamate dehydrogenase n=1 Tax=Hoyosella rhizosphaerae TaxID=1755582 RepID=A0A916UHI1_9ACTN|nr:NAD-glutamate dehydrogenase [Hoyosella rhizosphaerae]MBN4928123.1 NAD-glutamate dehydrogenase [Hoyosella rhizosphaerae]GGC72556.1 glutamate dehydrogenase [Hoyosella rhizosphaerae]
MTDSRVHTTADPAMDNPQPNAVDSVEPDHTSDGDLTRLYRTYYRQDAIPATAAGNAMPIDTETTDASDEHQQRAFALLTKHRELAAERTPGSPSVAIWGESDNADTNGGSVSTSVLQIVTDDVPFLVESVTALLGSVGISVEQIVHPVLIVRRNSSGELTEILTDHTTFTKPEDAIAESWMHLQLSGTPSALLTQIKQRVTKLLSDVRQVVSDTSAMRSTLTDIATELESQRGTGPATAAEANESAGLLRWLAAGNFRTLGYRRYEAHSGTGADKNLTMSDGSGLGVLRSPEMTDLRFRLYSDESEAKRILVFAQGQAPAMSLRVVYPFFVCVRIFDSNNNVVGEHRFLGIFTVTGLHENVLDVPVLATRVHEVLRLAGHSLDSFTGQSMLEIIQSYPRTELFTVDVETLHRTVSEVVAIGVSRELRLFLRADPNGRFVSALVYMPRDRYRTGVRLEMQSLLLREFAGSSIDYTARVTESVVAQVHFTIRIPDGWTAGTAPDVSEEAREELQRRLSEATRSWEDHLADEVARREPTALAAQANRFAGTFPQAYKEDFPPARALADLNRIERLQDGDIDIALYRKEGAKPGRWQLSLYLTGDGVSLSSVLPVMQSMGVEVLDERPYRLSRSDGEQCWIYDFSLQVDHETLQSPSVANLAASLSTAPTARAENAPSSNDLERRFTEAFVAVWDGLAESDRFNELILRAGLDWRQAMMLRAYARYLRQITFAYSQAHIEEVLLENANTASSLVGLFEATFDPVNHSKSRAEEIAKDLKQQLDDVVSLDADRILRAYLRLMRATLRTNYFVGCRDGIDTMPDKCRYREVLSFKFDPRDVPEIPKPRPRFEIFVYSPRIEGVHLRFGEVARGGLRWSDRREDFRTEVLGLAKAQAVKNAVIVPVGAKGGFVVKKPPTATGDPAVDRDAFRAEGIRCYRLFISGLLDITDNLDQVTGATISPGDVVRWDSDDTYLVVAADKGTATFSDIANGIAAQYNFWLGDAFASGGSAGYDHKAMGITAKGAWESVKRHFREMGIDTQTQDFTVVGIGDMSGDVFGNGMLLSEHIRLQAAFDHRHIFVDPNPDAASSFQERQRLFDLPRSSWEDYNKELISAGGGVWSRSVKSIPVSEQMREALGLPPHINEMSPPELMKAILLSPAQLLWNGGIGTYVKSGQETHGDVGDKANDNIRVNGTDLRVKVVGEGGNLGLTQRGRIEFAQRGGKVNSDALDNSAGVDCSDHEVNIKILLESLISTGTLKAEDRNELLASMTDEVSELVLFDNRMQNELMGTSRANSAQLLSVHTRQIADLVTNRGMDREIESLPDDEEILQRAKRGEGLASPELSTLLAHVKLAIKDDLMASDLPDNEVFAGRLPEYFPTALRENYHEAIRSHPLQRQIVSTMLANQAIDNGGITYAFRLLEDAGATTTDAIRAFAAVTEIFGLRELWDQIRSADMPTEASDQLMLATRRLLDRASRWLLANRPQPIAVGAEINRFAVSVRELGPKVPEWLHGNDSKYLKLRAEEAVAIGAPQDLATRVYALLHEYCLLDIVEVADFAERELGEVASLYFELTAHLGIDMLQGAVSRLERGDRWHALARLALRDDLYGSTRALCLDVLEYGEPDESAEEKIAEWELSNASRLERARTALNQISNSGTLDLATLSVAARQVRSMVYSRSLRSEAGR